MSGLKKIAKILTINFLFFGILVFNANANNQVFPEATHLNKWIEEKNIDKIKKYFHGKLYFSEIPSSQGIIYFDMEKKLLYGWEVKLDFGNNSLQFQSKGSSQNFELKVENNKLCVVWNGKYCWNFIRFYDTKESLLNKQKYAIHLPAVCIFSEEDLKSGEKYPETCQSYNLYEIYIEQYDKQKQVEFFKTGQYPFPGIEPKNPPATKSNKKRMGN